MTGVQCSVVSVQCSVFSVQCSVFSVQWSVVSVQWSVFSVQCSVVSVQCSVFSVQYSVFRLDLRRMNACIYYVQLVVGIASLFAFAKSLQRPLPRFAPACISTLRLRSVQTGSMTTAGRRNDWRAN